MFPHNLPLHFAQAPVISRVENVATMGNQSSIQASQLFDEGTHLLDPPTSPGYNSSAGWAVGIAKCVPFPAPCSGYQNQNQLLGLSELDQGNPDKLIRSRDVLRETIAFFSCSKMAASWRHFVKHPIALGNRCVRQLLLDPTPQCYRAHRNS